MKTNINTWTTLKAFIAAAKTAGANVTRVDRAVGKAEGMTCSNSGQDLEIIAGIKEIFKHLRT